MNEKQKIVLIIVAVIVLAMLLYPPFHIIVSEGGVLGRGYGWIFNPPHHRAVVNTGLLLTQWIGMLIVGIIAYLFFKDNK